LYALPNSLPTNAKSRPEERLIFSKAMGQGRLEPPTDGL
jgi:hypothetical protein